MYAYIVVLLGWAGSVSSRLSRCVSRARESGGPGASAKRRVYIKRPGINQLPATKWPGDERTGVGGCYARTLLAIRLLRM